MTKIRLENVDKIFPSGHRALSSLDLSVNNGEFLTLVGPSGCGKTTTLRIIAGLAKPTQGQVFLDEIPITNWPPHRRDVSIVFQNHVLYPHLNVRKNLAFGLTMRGMNGTFTAQRVTEVARNLALEDLLDRYPQQLSGGQQQRVALGRALARQPQDILLDEPLSQLDAPLRWQARQELKRFHQEVNATVLHVTHDQEEAMTLGDRVAVMKEGRLQQVAPPLEIYQRPANVFVAQFMGSPGMNLIPCFIATRGGQNYLNSPFFQLRWSIPFPSNLPSNKMVLGIRPHDVILGTQDNFDAQGVVNLIHPLGREAVVHLHLLGSNGEISPVAIVIEKERSQEGDRLGLKFPVEKIHLFEAVSGNRLD